MILFLLIAGIAAHATTVGLHCYRMWNAEQFQYFPVAFFAAGFIAVQQFRVLTSKREVIQVDCDKRRIKLIHGTTIALLILVCVLCFFSIVFNWALIAWFSLLIFFATIIFANHSWSGLKIMAPAFVVLLIIKPLPGGIEQTVTIEMQKIASQLASKMLDLLGIIHFKQGVIIHLVNKSFMAEEACSGIRSLFSSITAIVVWGLLNRYSIVRHGLNILQTICWVVLFNALRIAVVIAIEDRTMFSLATGLAHDVLGLIVFFSIFSMVLSTDQLIGTFARRANEIEDDSIADANRMEFDDNVDAFKSFLKKGWPVSKNLTVMFGVLFCLLTYLSIRTLVLIPDYISAIQPGNLPAPNGSEMPNPVSGWETIGFEHVHREQDYLQGRDSYIWHLKKQEKSVYLSIDGSFSEYHNLVWCYNALGWTCMSESNYSPMENVSKGIENPNGEFTKIELQKSSGETGLVIFTGIDRNGRVVLPFPEFVNESSKLMWYKLRNALRTAAFLPTEESILYTTFSPPISNIQLVHYPSSKLTDEETKEMVSLFLDAREILRNSERFRSGK